MPAKVEFARAATVYRELREALDPWAKLNGYRRLRGAKAGWTRALDQSRDLGFAFECSPWGSAATGGGSFHGTLKVRPSDDSGLSSGPLRQVPFRAFADFVRRHLPSVLATFLDHD